MIEQDCLRLNFKQIIIVHVTSDRDHHLIVYFVYKRQIESITVLAHETLRSSYTSEERGKILRGRRVNRTWIIELSKATL